MRHRGRPSLANKDVATLETLSALARFDIAEASEITDALGFASRATAYDRLTRLVILGYAERVVADCSTKDRAYRPTHGVGSWRWRITSAGWAALRTKKIPDRIITGAERRLERARHRVEVQERRVDVVKENLGEMRGDLKDYRQDWRRCKRSA